MPWSADIIAYLYYQDVGSTTGKIHLGRYLDLFPSLGNLEEQTSCSCDVRQSSLCVLGGALHHDLTARKCFQLKDKKRENAVTICGNIGTDLQLQMRMHICVVYGVLSCKCLT